MKTHKNIWLSLGSYVVAFAWFFIMVEIGSLLAANHKTIPFGGFMNFIVIAVFFIFSIIGIFFGFKSNKAKESSWAGNLLMVVGILIVLGYLMLMALVGGNP